MHVTTGKHRIPQEPGIVVSLLCVWLICSGSAGPCTGTGDEAGISSVNAGTDRTVALGDTVQLQGTSMGIGTHKWQFLSQPAGSTSQVQNADSLTGASFVADALGPYVVELLGAVSSAPGATDVQVDRSDRVTITAVMSGADGGSGGTGTTVECPDPDDLVTVADAYVRGGVNANTPYGEESDLLVKGDLKLNFARKAYLVFDLSEVPTQYSSVALVLTLQALGTATPVDLYGAVGDKGWTPMSLPSESQITWNNAPLNNSASANLFVDDMGGTLDPLFGGFDFGAPSAPTNVPPGTKYGIDVTAFVQTNEGQLITLMLSHSDVDTVGGPTIRSRETFGDDPCGAPFLHFETQPP